MRSLARQLNRAPVLLVATTLVVITASLSGRLLGVAATTAPPFIPDDVGRIGERGGWMQLQWNFVGPYGVDAPRAWANLVAAGGPGGRGVTVAVLDTEQTTRDLGRPGYDQLYGWGLVDVAYATAPGPARRPASN